MANCSIPNSTPASGRISTRSLKRSKRRNSASTSFFVARTRANAIRGALKFFNVQRPTPNAQCPIQTVENWMLDVGRWAFSFSGRVKGAWWPSRSSKPSSSRKWRDRFDSYPLRHFISDLRFSIADWPPRISDDFNRKSQFENRKSGEGR
jgi:hypothetical protein